jgi:hypothetical protein
MDPHLEGSLWMSFHTQLAAEIARQLALAVGYDLAVDYAAPPEVPLTEPEAGLAARLRGGAES